MEINNYLTYIVIFILIQRLKLFIYQDITYIDELQIGWVRYQYLVKKVQNYVDVYVKFWEKLWPCDFPFGKNGPREIPCDYILFVQFCSYPHWFRKYEYDKTPDKEGPTFRIQMVFGYIQNTYRPDLTCNPVYRFNFIPNMNTIDFKFEFILITEEVLINANYFRLSLDIGDRKFFQLFAQYEYYSFLRSAISNFNAVYLNEDIYIKTYCYPLASSFVLNSQKRSMCEPYYYGYNCWFYCVDDERQICNCEDPKLYFDVVCDIQCREGYTYRLISYYLFKGREVLKKCDIVNPCDSAQYICERICLPINNESYLCENPTYHFEYISGDQPTRQKRLFSNIFFYGETIAAIIDNNSLSKGFFDIGGTIYLNFYREDLVFVTDILRLNYHHNQFTANSGFTDVKFNFTLILYFMVWEETIVKTAVFKIYIITKEAVIRSKDTEESIESYICLMETLQCNGTSSPEYRAVFAWTMDGINITFPMDEEQFIPATTLINSYVISCAIYTIVEGYLDYEISNTTLETYVRVFRDFGWNLKDNVLNYTNVIVCSVTVYIPHQLNVTQMEGPTWLNITDTSVELFYALGGKYSFFCFFISKLDHIFTKTYSFHLRANPSFLCFYPYTQTVGAVIQCGHDGYFEDEYNIFVSFYTYKSFYKLIAEGLRYVKLPFNLENEIYRIDCDVVNINKEDLQFNFTIDGHFNSLTEKLYEISNLTGDCLRYYKAIELPDIIEDYQTSILVRQFVINLLDIELNELYPTILSTSLLIIIFIHLFIYIFLFIDDDPSLTRLLYIIKQYRYRIIKRNTHIRCDEEVRKILDQKLEGELYELFKKGLVENWDDDLRDQQFTPGVFGDRKTLELLRSTIRGLQIKVTQKSVVPITVEEKRFNCFKKSKKPVSLSEEFLFESEPMSDIQGEITDITFTKTPIRIKRLKEGSDLFTHASTGSSGSIQKDKKLTPETITKPSIQKSIIIQKTPLQDRIKPESYQKRSIKESLKQM